MVHSLLVQIEKCREEMISLCKSNAFTSKEVVHVSQHLDQLLNLHFKYSQKSSE